LESQLSHDLATSQQQLTEVCPISTTWEGYEGYEGGSVLIHVWILNQGNLSINIYSVWPGLFYQMEETHELLSVPDACTQISCHRHLLGNASDNFLHLCMSPICPGIQRVDHGPHVWPHLWHVWHVKGHMRMSICSIARLWLGSRSSSPKVQLHCDKLSPGGPEKAQKRPRSQATEPFLDPNILMPHVLLRIVVLCSLQTSHDISYVSQHLPTPATKICAKKLIFEDF